MSVFVSTEPPKVSFLKPKPFIVLCRHHAETPNGLSAIVGKWWKYSIWARDHASGRSIDDCRKEPVDETDPQLIEVSLFS